MWVCGIAVACLVDLRPWRSSSAMRSASRWSGWRAGGGARRGWRALLDRAGVREGRHEDGGRRARRGVGADGAALAWSLCRARHRWATGRAGAGKPRRSLMSRSRRRSTRCSRRCCWTAGRTGRRDRWRWATDLTRRAISRIWRAFGLEPTVSSMEAFEGPAGRGEGARHRRPVARPAGARDRAVRRREERDQALDARRRSCCGCLGRCSGWAMTTSATAPRACRCAGRSERQGDRELTDRRCAIESRSPAEDRP